VVSKKKSLQKVATISLATVSWSKTFDEMTEGSETFDRPSRATFVANPKFETI
jgi:hypothetical protein